MGSYDSYTVDCEWWSSARTAHDDDDVGDHPDDGEEGEFGEVEVPDRGHDEQGGDQRHPRHRLLEGREHLQHQDVRVLPQEDQRL